MNGTSTSMRANERQAEAWNGDEAVYFVANADRYDRQLEPFTHALLQRVADVASQVLEVGCGAGATALAAAARAEHVVGVDLSRPLLEVARRRAAVARITNAEFVNADAQTHEFVPGSFDLLISQFGLMFFDDPVAAFTNLRAALTADGRAAFVCWQGLHPNEWLTVIADAVRRHAELPEIGGLAGGPGMFALCRPNEVTALLSAAGFAHVECESFTPTMLIAGGLDIDDSVEFLLGGGMPRGLLGFVDPDDRDDVLRVIRSELADRYEEGVGIRLGAAAWLVTAQASSAPQPRRRPRPLLGRQDSGAGRAAAAGPPQRSAPGPSIGAPG